MVAREGRCAVPLSQQYARSSIPPTIRSSSSTRLRDISQQKEAERSLLDQARLASLAADVGTTLTHTDSLGAMLQGCSQAVVGRLDAAFARIWTLNAGYALIRAVRTSPVAAIRDLRRRPSPRSRAPRIAAAQCSPVSNRTCPSRWRRTSSRRWRRRPPGERRHRRRDSRINRCERPTFRAVLHPLRGLGVRPGWYIVRGSQYLECRVLALSPKHRLGTQESNERWPAAEGCRNFCRRRCVSALRAARHSSLCR
jgi:hypothetical protein